MNNEQLLYHCNNLFESLQSLNKTYNSYSISDFASKNNITTIYKDEYKKFHESQSKLTQRYSDILDGYSILYSDHPVSLKTWEHKWHFISRVIKSELYKIDEFNISGLEVVFQNIKDAIIKMIIQATTEIIIAVAWLKDNEIMLYLVNKAKKGVSIQIVISDSEENFTDSSYLSLFKTYSSPVWVTLTSSQEEMMHHKFCVIDKKHVITGSYNWTYKARMNFENILIVRNNPILAEDYLNKFEQIKDLPETVRFEEYKYNRHLYKI
jgi:phosphatidylserine/phosphatidylglycerophosphate/cardiolipin synthase-like enzyme